MAIIVTDLFQFFNLFYLYPKYGANAIFPFQCKVPPNTGVLKLKNRSKSLHKIIHRTFGKRGIVMLAIYHYFFINQGMISGRFASPSRASFTIWLPISSAN
jgi:hypothetical protein